MDSNHPKEKVIIVDDTDRPIGSLWRKDRTYESIYRVSALWLTNSKGQVLLAQRHRTKDRGAGQWGPAVAGTNEFSETYEQNIYKEAAEEIGLTGVKCELGPKWFMVYPGSHRYFCQMYTAKVDWPLEKFKIQEDEVEAIQWIGKN